MSVADTDLAKALEGLSCRSESDYPLEFVHWTKPEGVILDCVFVLEHLALGADLKAEEGDAQNFLESCCKVESWFGDEERREAQGFQVLRNALNERFEKLRLFRIGEVEVNLVVVGEDSNGDVLGFKTVSVET